MAKKDSYIVTAQADRTKALANYGEVIDSFDSTTQAKASYFGNLIQDVVKDIRVREEFGRGNYEAFRPGEAIPTKFKCIIQAVRSVYKRTGVVRNVIDLMTDFAVEDLKFLHPDKKIQAFYSAWARKTKLQDSANEFARHMLLDCNVIVKRVTARLSIPVEQELRDRYATASPDVTVLKQGKRVESREIPWRYRFLDICKLDWLNQESGVVGDDRFLKFTLPREIISMIRMPKTDLERQIVDNLPTDFKLAVNAQKNTVLLDMDKIWYAFNKKDDWEAWATPFLYSCLGDIIFKEKLRQAEVSALDGVINVIRLWKLGDHKEGIFPNVPAVNKLINILQAHPGGGAMDIVWDSMISLEDFYPPVDKILGSEKYTQVDKDILVGLGVPEILVGKAGANFSTSSMQLKVVIERLEYVRGKITDWLLNEASLINEAMGFSVLPSITFNQMSLRDEVAAMKLITNLLDRGILSPESTLEIFGKDLNLEYPKIKDQKKQFEKDGIEIKSPLPSAIVPVSNTTTPTAPPGRPFGTKDTLKRKPRNAKVRTKAELSVKAGDIIEAFEEFLVPIFLESKGLTNLRKTSAEHKEELNSLRVFILASLEPEDEISEDSLCLLTQEKTQYNSDLASAILSSCKAFASSVGRELTISQRKNLEMASWVEFYGTPEVVYNQEIPS